MEARAAAELEAAVEAAEAAVGGGLTVPAAKHWPPSNVMARLTSGRG